MVKKRDSRRKDLETETSQALSRRDFFTKGAAVGVGAAVLGSSVAEAQQAPAAPITWHYEADVVVLGAGSVGLIAALRAQQLGSTVLIVEQNFDAGGKLVHSGGITSLGGGDPIQQRDVAALDPQGLGLTAPVLPKEDMTDNIELLFTDMTDWSVADSAAYPTYRYNDREQHRAWADNAPATRQFMMDNYVRFARISTTHEGGGMSKARAALGMLKLAEKTDIKAGTLSRADAGDEERNSLFNPSNGGPVSSGTSVGAPGWITGGFAIARSLEFSAREKGIKFLMHRHMDTLIREQPNSGRVIGVTASYTPRMNPETGQRLEGYFQNGNIDERAPTINIRARKAVIIGTGGMMGNVVLRTMNDPRMSEPSIQVGDALMGPLHEDGSGILAAMRLGAVLSGMSQSHQHRLGSPLLQPVLGTSQRYEATFPGHPVFLFVKSKGISIGNGGWEHVINVNQVGKRFYNESAIAASFGNAKYPPGSDGTRKPFTPLDWRNSSIAQIKTMFNRSAASDAALAMNEGSKAPDFAPGPTWAIFDAAAVKRTDWPVRYPYIAEPSDGFFVKADTIAELAKKMMTNPFQKVPLKYLEETIARYNSLADKGKDDDFEKPVMHPINTPPFYAAIVPIYVNDSYGGLRINGKRQVVDVKGAVIPGLYAGGEASGGGRQHGIGRATVDGYIAATNAVRETA
jgi:hypothetical protein